MLKKFLVVALCLTSFSLFAQDKIGYVNSAELFNTMPEKAAAEKQLEDLAKQYEADLATINQEYKTKYESFMAVQDSLPENIKIRRMTEVQDLMQRAENFQQVAYQDMQKKQGELLGPISEKIRKAIKEVGDENGFTYVFDASNPALLYISTTSATDAMPLVKKKLGL